MRNKQDASDLLQAFRDSRNQAQEMYKDTPKKNKENSMSRGYDRKKIDRVNKSSDNYLNFLNKYENLDLHLDDFNTRDLMYFFREKAKEAGVKYVIANMKRDMGIFKRLQDNYSVREICLMIEFIFNSDQNYLDTSITQPTVLASNWCNTVYRDSLLWVDDKYFPKEKKVPVTREWSNKTTEEKADIGGWSE